MKSSDIISLNLFLLINIMLLQLNSSRSRRLKKNLDFYHKTEVLDYKLSSIVRKHSKLIQETSFSNLYNTNEYDLLKYYDISKNDGNTKENIFILGGEHAREMISTEIVYRFVKDLVNNRYKRNGLLDHYNFRIVVNGNPYGRRLVDQGYYCQRGNDKNIDLNRNWNIFWGELIKEKEENPGLYPFSEKETIFIRKAVKTFKPKIFLSLHSGVLGLYTPNAFLKRGVNKKNVNYLLPIQTKFCPSCKVGPASIKIGYQSSGTSLDYAYHKLKIPFSYTWEIYDSTEEELKEFAFKMYNRAQNNLKLRKKHKFYSFLQTKSRGQDIMCLKMFNPTSSKKFYTITNNWVNALNSFFKILIGSK